MITPEQINRINELARKAKTVGLTEEEVIEQKALRAEYVKAFRQSLESQLESTIIVRPDGSKERIVKKPTGKKPTGKKQ